MPYVGDWQGLWLDECLNSGLIGKVNLLYLNWFQSCLIRRRCCCDFGWLLIRSLIQALPIARTPVSKPTGRAGSRKRTQNTTDN